MYLQQYEKDYLDSRQKTEDDAIICEIPNCGRPANDIHHIRQSFHGKRQHNKNGSDLIALCRYHHNTVHGCNTIEMRDRLYSIVKDILGSIKSLLYDK